MQTLGITDQVRRAAQKQNRLASIIGCGLGAFVPIATCTLAHREADLHTLAGRIAIGLVLGGLLYSATTVYGWSLIAFQNRIKAFGFVVLLEGTMTLAGSLWLALIALGILTLINALATACNLATDQRESRKAERTARPSRAVVPGELRPISVGYVPRALPKPKPKAITVRKPAVAAKRAKVRA